MPGLTVGFTKGARDWQKKKSWLPGNWCEMRRSMYIVYSVYIYILYIYIYILYIYIVYIYYIYIVYIYIYCIYILYIYCIYVYCIYIYTYYTYYRSMFLFAMHGKHRLIRCSDAFFFSRLSKIRHGIHWFENPTRIPWWFGAQQDIRASQRVPLCVYTYIYIYINIISYILYHLYYIYIIYMILYIYITYIIYTY